MGAADFRVGGRIFATLAHQAQGYGNLMLSPEQQAAFVEEQPDLFVPIAGGWGRMGATHIRLAAANEDVLAGALRTAWKSARGEERKSRQEQADVLPKERKEERLSRGKTSGCPNEQPALSNFIRCKE